MQITRHASKRLQQRGLDMTVLRIVEELVLSTYNNRSQHILLKRKDARVIGSVLRKVAERVEKHAGVQLVLDESLSTLITVYRKIS